MDIERLKLELERMNYSVIEGVFDKKLIRHSDDRGFFMEILRDDDNLLRRFGQASLSKSYPGVIKAFHYHKRQDDSGSSLLGMPR